MRRRLRCLAVWALTAPGAFLGWPIPSGRLLEWCDRQLELARRGR